MYFPDSVIPGLMWRFFFTKNRSSSRQMISFTSSAKSGISFKSLSFFKIVTDNSLASITFFPEQARYIKERTWARDQRIIDQPDGSIILEMKTSGWWDVKRWVLSHGGDAEVLEPEKLRKEIREEAEEILELYSED